MHLHLFLRCAAVVGIFFAASAQAQEEKQEQTSSVPSETSINSNTQKNPVAKPDEEVLIILEEDEDTNSAVRNNEHTSVDPQPTAPPSGGDDGDTLLLLDDDGDQILKETIEKNRMPAVSGPLGRLWEAWHIAADFSFEGQAQFTDASDGPLRALHSLYLESWLLPAPNLDVYANGFARMSMDARSDQFAVASFADVYEAYAKIKMEGASVSLGRLVIPWGQTQAISLGDRLQPPDYRRGAPFPALVQQKQPEWGALVRTSFGPLGIEGVLLASYEPSEGSLTASDQGGVRIGRYQHALSRSPNKTGGLLRDDKRTELTETYTLASSAALGVRLNQRVGDFDIGGSVLTNLDETPFIDMPEIGARALASESLTLVSGVEPEIDASCYTDDTTTCFGKNSLQHKRTASLAVDAAWGVGIAVLRFEFLAHPQFLGLPGKTATLLTDAGLRSLQVPYYAGTLALEGAVGDFVSGSLELFNVVWQDVPAGSWLYGVELFNSDVASLRSVQRMGVAAVFSGDVMEQKLQWSLRGESGLLQPDVLFAAEVRYRLPILDLYVGGRSEVFTGFAGSPGWFRQEASKLSIFLGEGNK